MSKKKTTNNSGKHKKEEGSKPYAHSQLASGGELHQTTRLVVKCNLN